MANSLLQNLTNVTTTSDSDVLYIVTNPASTPADGKITVGELANSVLSKVYFRPEDSPFAVGGGDDTAAIQWAIDQAAVVPMAGMKFQSSGGTFQGGADAPGSGAVLLTRPVYDVSTVILKHRVMLEGIGWGVQLRQIANTNGPVVRNKFDSTAHAKYNIIRNLTVRGNRANQTTANVGILLEGDATNNYTNPIDEDYDANSVIDNVYVWDCKGDGIRLIGAGGVFVRGCKVRSCDGNGIYSFQDNNIDNCDIGWSGLAGLTVVGDSCRVTNVKCWYSGQITASSGHGFYLTADSGVISGCTAQDNKAAGFLWDGAFGWAGSALEADNNDSAGSDYPGFDFFGSQYCQVMGIARNRYNAGATAGTQSIGLRHRGSSTLNDIRLVAAAGVWGVLTASSGDTVKSGSTIVINGTAL
ncbi:MAG: right-handed parallel beta-helix repeat-containing protein [bacterium]|nr:right-handed parallel beta-helix repeat-containing protein [bacterium]